jgi:hypothetical protein
MKYASNENSFSKNHTTLVFIPLRLILRTLLLTFAIATMFEGSAFSQVAFSLNDQIPVSDSYQYQSNPQLFETSRPLPLSSESKNTFTMLFGIEGSKEPQDFGVNANLGVVGQLSFSAPLIPNAGVGFQIGNSATFSGNAVQVFELLGESKDRFQNFTTVGLFQRLDSGVSWGVTYDFLNAESFDSFQLGQWRVGAAFDVSPNSEIGVTANLANRSDQANFNAETVKLEPIEQLRIHFRRQWETGASTAVWIGIADQHSEENAVTGTLPNKQNQILFGAELFAPLNQWLAIFGETNLMMPADTGVVNAYLGMQISPRSIRWAHARNNRFRPFLPVATGASFSVDLNRR